MVLTRLNSEELVAFNPHLSDYAPAARRAYAKFRTALDDYNTKYKGPETTQVVSEEKKKASNRESIRKLVIEKAKSMESTPSLDGEQHIKKAAADLENVINAPSKSPVKSSGGGVVNKGFQPDEPEVCYEQPARWVRRRLPGLGRPLHPDVSRLGASRAAHEQQLRDRGRVLAQR